jgi:threonine/homoserine/homoserine lactone efflux protein
VHEQLLRKHVTVDGAAGRILSLRRVRVWLDRVTATLFMTFGLRLVAETAHD